MTGYDPDVKMGCGRSILAVFAIIVGIAVCTLTTVFTVDAICYGNAQEWIPYYPTAEIVSEETSGARMWGIGVTRATLHTNDEASEVRRFYDQLGIKPNNLLATVRWATRPADDGGVNIFLYSECGAE